MLPPSGCPGRRKDTIPVNRGLPDRKESTCAGTPSAESPDGNREMGFPSLYRGAIRWGRGIGGLAFLGTVLAVACFCAGLPLVAAPADAPDAEELVRCPHCDEKGRIDCPVCKGRGEIFRTCEICGGKGRKPCPVCVKDSREENAAPPGQVVCGYCGGSGTLGSTGKICQRCAGAGFQTCLTCGGKGTVPCAKEVFVRVCRHCRYVRKVTCPTCGGTRLVSPAVAASKRGPVVHVPDGDDDPTGEEPGEGEAPGQHSGSVGGDERDPQSAEEAVPTESELRQRYEALVPVCEAHLDIFTEDLAHRAENIQTEGKRRVRKLITAGIPAGGELITGIETLVDRANSFRRRWYQLRQLHAEERRSYLNTKKAWTQRAEALDNTAQVLRPDVEETWNRRLALHLRILEKNVAPLQEDDPEWIPDEVAALESQWKKLNDEADAVLVALREAREASRDEPPPQATESSPTGADPDSKQPVRSTPPSPPSKAQSRPEPPRENPGKTVTSSVETVSPPPTDEAPSRARIEKPREAPSTPPRESGSAGGLYWAIIGFLLASALFLVGSWLRRQGAMETAE